MPGRHDPGDYPTPIREALSYARLGLPVIPLYPKSKRPRIERWPERATTEPERIVHWFEMWPDANLAILTGRGVMALDVDPRNGGPASLKTLVRRRKMPATAEALTGAGDRHFLFRVDPGVKIASKDGFMKGLDLKGEGGMLVVEPSLHPGTRREYVWVRAPQHGIAKAPRWLLDQVPRVERAVLAGGDRPPRCVRPGEESALLEQIIERFPVPGPGHRNDRMYRAVGSLLGREYEPDLVRRVVMDWVRHFHALGVIGTDPGRVEREVEACIRSTMRNPDFWRASSGIDHRARIAEVELDPAQRRLIERGTIREGHITVSPGTVPP